jgi:hypothetical protein
LAVSILTLAKLLHLVGLVAGFGSAATADWLVLRNAILRPVNRELVTWLNHLSRVAMAGLALLWVSGIALIAVRYAEGAPILSNQKIWAKVVIVILLTINGILVHNLAFKQVRRRIGNRLFDGRGKAELAGLAFIASVSTISWIAPFVLGTAAELNYKVSVGGVLAVYAATVVLTWIGVVVALNVWLDWFSRHEAGPPLSVRPATQFIPLVSPKIAGADSRDEIHDKYLELLHRVRAMSRQSFDARR